MSSKQQSPISAFLPLAISTIFIYFSLFRPLSDSAALAKTLELDPRTITDERLPVSLTATVVLGDFFITYIVGGIALSTSRHPLVVTCKRFIECTIFFTFILYLCGETLTNDILNTILCAINLTTQIVGNSSINQIPPPSQLLSNTNNTSLRLNAISIGAIVGAIILPALFLPLDAGLQMQRFPAVVIIGALIGRILGTAITQIIQ